MTNNRPWVYRIEDDMVNDDDIIILKPSGFADSWPSNDFMLGYNKGYAAAKEEMRDAWDNGYEAGMEGMRRKLKEMGIEFHFGEEKKDDQQQS